MSIVTLRKITLVALAKEKTEVLSELQRLGCVHLVPLRPEPDAPEQEASARPEEWTQAIKHLRASGRRRRQVLHEPDFDVDDIVAKALANKQRIRDAVDQRDMLMRRIHNREPWGDFEFPDEDDLGGYRFWFYILPHGKKAALADLTVPWEIVHEDNLSAYVLVISKSEPPAGLLPVPRVHTGPESLHRLRERLEETEIELDGLKAERDALTRWIFLLEQNIASAEDAASLRYAHGITLDDEALCAVQGWAPLASVGKLEAYAAKRKLGLLVEKPTATDRPPTLLDNAEPLAGGADLVSFYQTPAYSSWDPSRIVLFSFALFFAMILGDAGYAALLGGLLLAFWKSMGASELGRRMRSMSAIIVSLSVVYGMLAGSYFGVTPGEGSWLRPLKVLSLDDFDTMIRLSVVIGAAHVALANSVQAMNLAGWQARVVPLSWNAVIAGSLLLWLFGDVAFLSVISIGFIASGAIGVLGFGSLRKVETAKDLALRIAGGLLSLTNVTKVFGDVLSYLRLFALGLASASLAITFNQLAADVAAAALGAGLLFKILILLLGHSLNLALAIISGVVHGLRLNFIEFFNWGMAEEGYPFRPFHKKEIEL